jgi:hypothetical protein
MSGPNGAANVALDWSTSYQAGSSRCVLEIEIPPLQTNLIYFFSSASSSSDDDTEDEASTSSRGRSTSLKPAVNTPTKPVNGSSIRRRESRPGSSGDSAGSATNLAPNGIPFTRSHSPASARQPTNLLASRTRRHASPMSTRTSKHKGLLPITILPASLDIRIRVPLTAWVYTFNVDLRKFGESLLLLGTLVIAATHFYSFPEPDFFPKAIFDVRYWLTTGVFITLFFIEVVANERRRNLLSLYCIVSVLCLDSYVSSQRCRDSSAVCQGATSAYTACITDDSG